MAIAKNIESKGRPIPTKIRKVLEAKLGVDLSKVRIVVGKTARKTCDAAGAEALTIKNKILLSKKRYEAQSSYSRNQAHYARSQRKQTCQNERDARKSEGLVKRGSKAFEALDPSKAGYPTKKMTDLNHCWNIQ